MGAVKGRTENHLAKLPFKAVYLFRPAFIKPIPGLKHAHGISRLVGAMYPLLNVLLPRYACTLEDVGNAMVRAALSGHASRIIENRDIAQFAKPASSHRRSNTSSDTQ